MEVYAIRHPAYVDVFDKKGRKLVHNPESPLSDLGRLQSRQLAAKLRAIGVLFDELFLSPYPRAWEMGEILAKELGTSKLHKVDGLKDVFPNSANGKPWEDLEAIGADIYAHPMGGDPQETLEHLVERSGLIIRTIVEINLGRKGSIGIISHGDTLSAMDWSLRNSSPPKSYEEMQRAFYLDKAQACIYRFDGLGNLIDSGQIITPDAAMKTMGGFRGPSK